VCVFLRETGGACLYWIGGSVCLRAPKSSNGLISRKREAYTCIEDATVMATFTYILHLYTLDYLGHFE
jgi:hypothetical protein